MHMVIIPHSYCKAASTLRIEPRTEPRTRTSHEHEQRTYMDVRRTYVVCLFTFLNNKVNRVDTYIQCSLWLKKESNNIEVSNHL